jgi:hypothetical protein
VVGAKAKAADHQGDGDGNDSGRESQRDGQVSIDFLSFFIVFSFLFFTNILSCTWQHEGRGKGGWEAAGKKAETAGTCVLVSPNLKTFCKKCITYLPSSPTPILPYCNAASGSDCDEGI